MKLARKKSNRGRQSGQGSLARELEKIAGMTAGEQLSSRMGQFLEHRGANECGAIKKFRGIAAQRLYLVWKLMHVLGCFQLELSKFI